jgi:chloramphenicol 3-O-phosphotransferase
MGRALDDARARGKRVILDSTGMSFRFQALIARVRTQAVHVHLSVDVEQWKAREQMRRDRAQLGEDVYRRSSEIAFESPPDLVVDTSRLTVDEVVDRVARAWEQRLA